jgi:AcrR family transcriptional regulator
MLEIIAERGYAAVTVRELAQVASVSSRAFYQHYSGKEDCFLSAHETIVRRIDRRVSLAQHGELDWRRCLRLTIDAYLGELQREPCAAGLLLIDAYVAGPLALAHVRRAERALETRLTTCFNLAANGLALPALITRGMAGGLICVARSRLAKDQKGDLTALTDNLTAWASSVFMEVLGQSRSDSSDAVLHQSNAYVYENQHSSWPADDERSLIVLALAKLVAVEEYKKLTVRKIRDSAGASSKKFSAHFTDVADCFEEAVEHYGAATISQLAEGRSGGDDAFPNAGSMDPIAQVCQRTANDITFARLCFADIFGPGRRAVECLDCVIEELEAVLVEDLVQVNGASVGLEASAAAAAIWAALREEILAGRRAQLPEAASQLRFLTPAPSVGKDGKHNAPKFDQPVIRRDAQCRGEIASR